MELVHSDQGEGTTVFLTSVTYTIPVPPHCLHNLSNKSTEGKSTKHNQNVKKSHKITYEHTNVMTILKSSIIFPMFVVFLVSCSSCLRRVISLIHTMPLPLCHCTLTSTSLPHAFTDERILNILCGSPTKVIFAGLEL